MKKTKVYLAQTLFTVSEVPDDIMKKTTSNKKKNTEYLNKFYKVQVWRKSTVQEPRNATTAKTAQSFQVQFVFLCLDLSFVQENEVRQQRDDILCVLSKKNPLESLRFSPRYCAIVGHYCTIGPCTPDSRIESASPSKTITATTLRCNSFVRFKAGLVSVWNG